MKKLSTLLLVVSVVLAMAAGTMVQRLYGAAHAIEHVYHSWWFAGLWVLLAILAIAALVKKRIMKRPAVMGIHLAFLFILVGMIISSFAAQSGRITLAPDIHASLVDSDHGNWTLPFSVQLNYFEVVNYPGTQSPQDFVSIVTFNRDLQDTISMNHIARYGGYHFCLSGYSPDGEVILTVTHDPWGTGLNYAGYLILLVSMLGFFFDPHSRFRQLIKGGMALLLLAISAEAQALPRTLPRESAERMGRLCVNYQGRICPVSTLARDFTTKLYGSPTYKGLTSEQVLSGWLYYYSDWQQEPIIKLKGGEAVKSLFHTSSSYVSVNDYIDNMGQYRLKMLDTMAATDPRYSSLMAVNEKYLLVVMLYGGELLKMYPIADSVGNIGWYSHSDPLPLQLSDDEYLFIRKSLSYSQELVLAQNYASLDTLLEKTLSYQKQRAGHTLPSDTRLMAEQIYTSIAPSKTVSIFCIMAGLCLFFLLIVRKPSSSTIFSRVSLILTVLESLYLLLLFSLRWYVSSHVPLSNGYETMYFLALSISALVLFLHRRMPAVLAVGPLLTGVAMMVAMMGNASPMVTQLMPVLHSPLLCIHVATIMLSYALLALMAILAVSALLFMNHLDQQRMARTCQIIAYPALFLLTAGIFIGAVWANQSWGTYWSWDPKEVWALITLIVYSALLHGRSLTHLQHPRPILIYSIVAFLSVLITYFGVNFFLGGMHSYA